MNDAMEWEKWLVHLKQMRKVGRFQWEQRFYGDDYASLVDLWCERAYNFDKMATEFQEELGITSKQYWRRRKEMIRLATGLNPTGDNIRSKARWFSTTKSHVIKHIRLGELISLYGTMMKYKIMFIHGFKEQRKMLPAYCP